MTRTEVEAILAGTPKRAEGYVLVKRGLYWIPALIVHSVNLHDALVEALQAARFYVPKTATSGHILATIDALLAKATS